MLTVILTVSEICRRTSTTMQSLTVTCCHGKQLRAVPRAASQQGCCSLFSETRANSPARCHDVAAPYAAELDSVHSMCTLTFDRLPSSAAPHNSILLLFCQ